VQYQYPYGDHINSTDTRYINTVNKSEYHQYNTSEIHTTETSPKIDPGNQTEPTPKDYKLRGLQLTSTHTATDETLNDIVNTTTGRQQKEVWTPLKTHL
jgi:hypothetical protein